MVSPSCGVAVAEDIGVQVQIVGWGKASWPFVLFSQWAFLWALALTQVRASAAAAAAVETNQAKIFTLFFYWKQLWKKYILDMIKVLICSRRRDDNGIYSEAAGSAENTDRLKENH